MYSMYIQHNQHYMSNTEREAREAKLTILYKWVQDQKDEYNRTPTPHERESFCAGYDAYLSARHVDRDAIVAEARKMGIDRPWEGSADIDAHAQDSITNLVLRAFAAHQPPADWVLDEVAERVPFELNDDTLNILGKPNFVCGPIARILRSGGMEIETKAEIEQALVIHWLLGFYMKHGSEWYAKANDTLKQIAEAQTNGDQ